MRRVVVLVLILAALVTDCGVRPKARPPEVPPEVGVQFHGTWADYDDDERAMVLDTLVRHGVSTVRIDVSWRMLEPNQPGEFDPDGLAVVDKAITMAAERGLRPLVMLWMAPEWANDSQDERVPPTSDRGLAGLTSVASRLAEKYRGTVDAWEVWNEPNDDDFMRGADPVEYAQVLRAAYAGFKAGDAGSTVVFGGPSYVDDTWVARALAAGAAGQYDVMGVHPYMRPSDEPPDLPDDGTMWRLNHLPSLIDVMAEYGDVDIPIWFTEFGWSVHPDDEAAAPWDRGVTPAEQAEYLAQTVDLVRASYPMVTRLYWYRARAESTDRQRAGFGLVFPDGSVAPALRELPTVLTPPSTAPSQA